MYIFYYDCIYLQKIALMFRILVEPTGAAFNQVAFTSRQRIPRSGLHIASAHPTKWPSHRVSASNEVAFTLRQRIPRSGLHVALAHLTKWPSHRVSASHEVAFTSR